MAFESKYWKQSEKHDDCLECVCCGFVLNKESDRVDFLSHMEQDVIQFRLERDLDELSKIKQDALEEEDDDEKLIKLARLLEEESSYKKITQSWSKGMIHDITDKSMDGF